MPLILAWRRKARVLRECLAMGGSKDDAGPPTRGRECRICLGEVRSRRDGCVRLGCGCSHGDEFMHRKCAERWFGDTRVDATCEVCGAEVTGLPEKLRARIEQARKANPALRDPRGPRPRPMEDPGLLLPFLCWIWRMLVFVSTPLRIPASAHDNPGSTALRESLGVAALLGLPLALPFLTYGLLHDPDAAADAVEGVLTLAWYAVTVVGFMRQGVRWLQTRGPFGVVIGWIATNALVALPLRWAILAASSWRRRQCSTILGLAAPPGLLHACIGSTARRTAWLDRVFMEGMWGLPWPCDAGVPQGGPCAAIYV